MSFLTEIIFFMNYFWYLKELFLLWVLIDPVSGWIWLVTFNVRINQHNLIGGSEILSLSCPAISSKIFQLGCTKQAAGFLISSDRILVSVYQILPSPAHKMEYLNWNKFNPGLSCKVVPSNKIIWKILLLRWNFIRTLEKIDYEEWRTISDKTIVDQLQVFSFSFFITWNEYNLKC